MVHPQCLQHAAAYGAIGISIRCLLPIQTHMHACSDLWPKCGPRLQHTSCMGAWVLHPCHSPSACVAVAVQGWTWSTLRAHTLSCSCTASLTAPVSVRGQLGLCGGTCCLPACAAYNTTYSSFLAEMINPALLLLAEDCCTVRPRQLSAL